jgi:predicted HD phosphohydrolase
MKNTIKITGKYTGADKSNLKKGDPMYIELSKDYLKASYMNDAFNRHINNVQRITLLHFVKQKVQRIFSTDSLYL